jgi:hypothetical protein
MNRINGSFVWSVVLGLFIIFLLIVARGFPDSLRFTPYLAGFGTVAMTLVLLAGNFYPEILRWTETTLQDMWGGSEGGSKDEDSDTENRNQPWPAILLSMSYAVGFFVLVFVFGFTVITPMFISLYLIREARVAAIWAVPVACGVTTALVVAMLWMNVEVWAGIGPEIVPDFIGGAIMPPL